jgi:large subunit ribosomal protein L10
VNREQKAATIAEIVGQIKESEAVYAVDYRGISVTQAAELRTRLRDADATFRVVKNTLTERAADEAGADGLKTLLAGPTALTFVRGDAALAAKALRDYARTTPELLAFKGGLLGTEAVDADQIRAIAALPAREVLYGQLVGIVASPITGLARTLNALVGGLAIALGGVLEKKESGEIAAGAPPQPGESASPTSPEGDEPAAAPEAEAEAPAAEAPADETPDQDAEPPDSGTAEEVQPDQAEGEDAPAETQTETQED